MATVIDLDIPPLPALAAEVIREAGDPLGGAKAVARAVERDPALAATVIRIARTAAYGAIPPRTLQQALARIGTRTLTEVVVAECLRTMVVAPEVAGRVQHAWGHAVGTAFYARQVSAARRCHTESTFLCGLLHSIGALIELRAGVDLDPVATGMRAAREWSLPEEVAQSIAHHGDPTHATAHRLEVATTSLAAVLATEALGDRQPTEIPSMWLDWLDMYPDAIEKLRGEADVVLTRVKELT